MNSKTFNLSMPRELVKKIDRQVKRSGSTRSDFIRQAVNKQLNVLEQWESLTKSIRSEYKGPRLTEQQVADIVRQSRDEAAKK